MSFLEACGYVGPAPVPLVDYVISVEAQSITAEAPGPEKLAEAVQGISVDPSLFESLGPAINSGAGMFLYGTAGQRQIDAGQADHDLLRPGDLDSARALRGRPDHQVLRHGLPQAGDQRRAEHHQVRRS